MTVETRVHDAASRVSNERKAFDAKLDAFDRFIDRVEECSPDSGSQSLAGAAGSVRAISHGGHPRPGKYKAVRCAFAETIRPHSLDDVEQTEPLVETIRVELSESVAVALAPATETRFSPAVKEAVLSQARARRTETKTLYRALEREASQLEVARAVVDEITGWIATNDETPLSELGFEELRRRHETLATHRTRCQEVADRRQAFLDGTTTNGSEAELDHRNVVEFAYGDFPVNYPVLSTVARFDDTCRECQRAVRDHLVRRV